MKERIKDTLLMVYAGVLAVLLFIGLVAIPASEEKEEKKVCNKFCSIQDTEPKINEPGVCVCKG